jgi:hypothetical protein
MNCDRTLATTGSRGIRVGLNAGTCVMDCLGDPRRMCGGGKEAVHIVRTLAVGLGRTGAGSGRTRHVLGSSQCFRGPEPGSSPTSGTFSHVRGPFLGL